MALAFQGGPWAFLVPMGAWDGPPLCAFRGQSHAKCNPMLTEGVEPLPIKINPR